MDINKAFGLLMQQEGISLINVAGDKGGLTKFGIAAASHPELDVANLTEEQAKEIYQKEYWNPLKIDQLPVQLQYAVFSCGVNCGVGTAAKILKRAARVTDDGIIGAGTIASAKQVSIYDFSIEWNCHYKAIVEKDATQQKFFQGWQNRINFIISLFKEGKLN